MVRGSGLPCRQPPHMDTVPHPMEMPAFPEQFIDRLDWLDTCACEYLRQKGRAIMFTFCMAGWLIWCVVRLFGRSSVLLYRRIWLDLVVPVSAFCWKALKYCCKKVYGKSKDLAEWARISRRSFLAQLRLSPFGFWSRENNE